MTPLPNPKAEKDGRKTVKVVMKRRNVTKSKLTPSALRGARHAASRGIPSMRRRTNAASSGGSPSTSLEERSAWNETDEFPFFDALDTTNDDDDDSVPCDTLIAMRCLQQGGQSLQVPLTTSSASVSCVLESQLYETLQTSNGEDSVVTQELQHLLATNRVRRLVDVVTAGGGRGSAGFGGSTAADTKTTTIQAIMLSNDHLKAVWDAHRTYVSHNPITGTTCTSSEATAQRTTPANQVTSWFTSNLNSWTKRTISQEDLEESWAARTERKPSHVNYTSTAASVPCQEAIDTLVHMQVLLPVGSSRKFILWLPKWGIVLQQLWKAERKVVQQLKRSLYKELSQSQLAQQRYPGLSGAFVVQHLLAQGKVDIQKRPAGSFVRLARPI